MPSSRLHLVIAVLFSIILIGCTEDEIVSDLKQYQDHLASALGTEFTWSKPNTTLSFPAHNQLNIAIPEASIQLRDFYALQDCPVGTLIAERNTALGKTQLPSTRYHYEVQLIGGLEQCLQSTQDVELQTQLTGWIKQKRSALPLVWTNLIQTSSEIKQALSSNQRYLNVEAVKDLNQFTSAFEYLVTLPAQSDVDISKLEDSLNSLRQIEMVARLWKTQKLFIIELYNTTELLAQQTSDIQCANSVETQQVNHLGNIFQQFFIERIQPMAAAIDKSNDALKPAFDLLLKSKVINILIKQMISENLQNFVQYQITLRQHIMLWQALFERCNLSPQKR